MITETATYDLVGAEAIHDFLQTAYGASLRMRSDDDRPRLRHRRVDAGAFCFDTGEQPAHLEFGVEPHEELVIARTATSRVERACGGFTGRYDAGDLFVSVLPGEAYSLRWAPGKVSLCVIDSGTLNRVGAAGPVRFTALEPHTRAAAAHWWATRTYVTAMLGNPEAAASPLVVSSAADLLCSVTLATFPNTAVGEITLEERRDATAAAVRRAIAHIESHPADELSAAGLAEIAGVSVRTLRLAFRRLLGTSPMAYVRQVRLSHAHEELTNADPATTTVGEVAARWGFGDRAGFTDRYRRMYGTTPSRTLRDS